MLVLQVIEKFAHHFHIKVWHVRFPPVKTLEVEVWTLLEVLCERFEPLAY